MLSIEKAQSLCKSVVNRVRSPIPNSLRIHDGEPPLSDVAKEPDFVAWSTVVPPPLRFRKADTGIIY